MSDKKKIESTINEILEERDDLFVVNQHITDSLNIHITIDGDKLVNISDCIEISRNIEKELDKEELDFSIQVQSPGADEPLILPRQYKKHIGRNMTVQTDTEITEGKLVEIDQDNIQLVWKTREKKPVGKGKHTVEHNQVIPFSSIKEAKINITFNK